MFLANKLNKGAGVPTPKDAQFNYVTMLLHGDGTNGAQNNTFLDSSTNNFTITRNGNTTQGSFSPYGSNWGNYFDGTSTLAFPSNSAFAFGTGAYTVEMWVFVTGVGSNGYSHFFNAGNATGSFGFAIYSDYSLNVFGYGTGGVITGSANDITPNTWQHIAVCRSSTSSNDTKIYVNGVLKTTGTDSTNWTVTTTPAVGGITNLTGYSTIGYISNCRVVKGTAVYTSAFTPSTTPLTAISGTSLLTCADNRFLDDSTNNFTITINGAPSVQRFNPFGTATAYSTSVIGGSGYFDGTGDYLTAASTTAFDLASGTDFTFSCWVYFTSNPNNGTIKYIFDQTSTSGSGSVIFLAQETNNNWTACSMASAYSSSDFVAGQWYWITISRVSGTLRSFKNGVQITSGSNSDASDTNRFTIGARYSDNFILNSAYLSNIRFVVGSGITSDSVPIAPISAITNTSLLLNTTNGAIIDNAMMNDLETVGNTQISTSVKKYGTGSLAFDGTGDYLSTRSTPNLSFGSGDFTIEAWVYATSLGSYNAVFAQWPDNGGSTNNSYTLETVGSNMEFYYASGSTLYGPTTLGTITTGVWIHYAICRSGNTLYPFKNGVLGTTTSITQTLNSPTSAVTVGGAVAGGGDWIGYIDDLRITKGYARYTATFTPPTAALPDIGPI